MSIKQPAAASSILLPYVVPSLAAAVWSGINRAVFMRIDVPVGGYYQYINWSVSVQSGNVQVGVAALSGSLHSTYTPIASTGVIACPAAGDIRSDIGSVYLNPGDYALYQWADNVTFQTRTNTGVYSYFRVMGVANSLASGVVTPGTLAWSNTTAGLALEANI